MTNGEYLVQNSIPFNAISANKRIGVKFWNIYNSFSGRKIGIIEADSKYFDSDSGQPTESAYRAILRWLDAKYKEPVLTDKEHDYLAAVIKPWRENVCAIQKARALDNSQEHIIITLSDTTNVMLPLFPKGTMYKGMVASFDYFLDDLDL